MHSCCGKAALTAADVWIGWLGQSVTSAAFSGELCALVTAAVMFVLEGWFTVPEGRAA